MTAAPDRGPREIVFVEDARSVPPRRPGRLIVVLDMAWTPRPGGRPDVVAVRTLVQEIVERRNLFNETLDRLDEWAEAAGAPDAFIVDGATWWFHARGFLRLAVHELLLWRAIIDAASRGSRPTRLVVPGRRAWLVAAARAGAADGGARVRVTGLTQAQRRALRVLVRPGRRLFRTLRGGVAVRSRTDRTRLQAELDRRLESRRDRGAVLAVLRDRSFHVMGSGPDASRGDPYVSPVLARLADEGVGGLEVVLGLRYGSTAQAEVAAHAQLMPLNHVTNRFGNIDQSGIGRGELSAQLRGMRRARMVVDGVDLGPTIRAEVIRQAAWLREQALTSRTAYRLITELRPAALLTGWEAARTSWLVAARRAGVPIVSIQHGVIYPKTPDYVRPHHRAHVLSDLTCTFGSYERDLLLDEGGYPADAVVVTGSPRATPESAAREIGPLERAAIRRQLGVADVDRLLVVSTARHSVGDEFHGMAMVATLFDGPLPGIHVVFKLHPEEQEGGHYVSLVRGLAAARGHRPPEMSVVRDIDIYRLLRASDAHLGQYSTVLTDAVLTQTPNMVAVGHAWADIIGYVGARVAVPVRSVDDVRAFMTAPVAPLPEDRARFLERHARSGDATGRIAALVREAIAR
jgi:hypothetical protein